MPFLFDSALKTGKYLFVLVFGVYSRYNRNGEASIYPKTRHIGSYFVAADCARIVAYYNLQRVSFSERLTTVKLDEYFSTKCVGILFCSQNVHKYGVHGVAVFGLCFLNHNFF